MLEQVEETILAILYADLPKNASGQPVIYDRVITGWNIGERTPQPNAPQITAQAASSSPKEIAAATYLMEHRVTISLGAANASSTITERNILEFVRVLYEILLRHRRFWVIEMCPFCKKFLLSPQHFYAAHGGGNGSSDAYLAPYIAAVVANFSAMYYETHPSTDTLPDLETPNVGAVALLALFDAVQAANAAARTIVSSFSNIPSSALSVIQSSLATMRRPIRLLDEARFGEIRPSDGGKETQNYRSAEFTFTARELYKQITFGTNVVPTAAYIPSS